MGVIYTINKGFKKSKQPVDIQQTTVNNDGSDTKVSVGNEEDLIIQSNNLDYSSNDESLNVK